MNTAQKYVEYLYSRYSGRIPLAAGLTHGFGKVYPFVFEDSEGRAIGCVGLAWNQGHDLDLVQIYHLNAFKPSCSLISRMSSNTQTEIAQARWRRK